MEDMAGDLEQGREAMDLTKFQQNVAKFAIKPEKLENIAWPEWKFMFTNWMTMMDIRYGNLMEMAERQEGIEPQTDPELRALEGALYAILASLLVGKDQRILRAVPGRNGWEGWRQLV